MRFKLLLILFFCFGFISHLYAGTYLGLEPGISTKKDADRVLGAPIKEVSKGIRYDYAAQKYDLKQLSVVFSKETSQVDCIYLYFLKSYSKPQLKEWFKLGVPTNTSLDTEGKLIEYYPQGVALYFSGPDDTAAVEYCSHFNLAMLSKESSQTKTVAVSTEGSAEKIPFLGINLNKYEGQGIRIVSIIPESPAEEAGLKPGDIILEIENRTFYTQKIEPRDFVAFIKMLPVDNPLRFLVKRGERKFEIKISLRLMTKDQIGQVSEARKEQARIHAEEGDRATDKKDYVSAIVYFKEAIADNPFEAYYYTELGNAYYYRGEPDLALDAMQKSLRLKPEYFPFYGAGMIYWEKQKYDEATPYLKEAVRLKPKEIKDTAALELLGNCYLQKNMFEDAAGVFLEAYKINRNSPTASYSLGVCYDKMGDASKAVAFYRQYLKLPNRDSKMEAQARIRLNALVATNPNLSSSTTDSLNKLIDVMGKEWEKFNKE